MTEGKLSPDDVPEELRYSPPFDRGAAIAELLGKIKKELTPPVAPSSDGAMAELRGIVNGFLEWHEGSPCPEGLVDRARAAMEASAAPSAVKEERGPWVNVRGCGWHHYTPENIAAMVRDLRAVEEGTEQPEWINRDHRARCGILWRVISALSHDVPLNPDPVIASDVEIAQGVAASPVGEKQ